MYTRSFVQMSTAGKIIKYKKKEKKQRKKKKTVWRRRARRHILAYYVERYCIISSRHRSLFSHKPPCTVQSCTWYGFLTGGSAAGLLFSDFSGVAALVVLATSASMSDTSSSTSAAEHASRPHSWTATSPAAAESMPRMADSMHEAAITDGFFVMNSGSADKTETNENGQYYNI